MDAAGKGRLLDPSRLGDYLDRLYRAAFALCGSRERAEDLVQDTYARVLSRPRLLRRDDDLGYLLHALRNTHISHQRAARSRPQPAVDEEPDWLEDSTAAQPDSIAENRLLYDTIAALPRDYREALVAVDVVGLRYGEAADALRIPEGTLATRVFRARRKVADALRGEPERTIPETQRDQRKGSRPGVRPCPHQATHPLQATDSKP
jgi:RNA polymerase sigma-70 factor (ECF subfamily)